MVPTRIGPKMGIGYHELAAILEAASATFFIMEWARLSSKKKTMVEIP